MPAQLRADLPYSRVLHIAHGIPSCNNSMTEMLRRLCSAGVQVTVASHVDLSGLLKEMDVTFELLTRDQELRKQCSQGAAASTGPAVLRMWQKLNLLRHFRSLSLHNDEVINLIKHARPDIILIDMECHFSIISAMTTDVPIALCSRWFSVFRSRGLPPMHTGLQPGGSWRNRMAIEWSWYRLGLRKWRQYLRNCVSIARLQPIVYETNSRLNLSALSKALGRCLRDDTSQRHWLIPHVYNTLPVMSLTAEALEFPQAADPRMHYVGAMVGASGQAGQRAQPALLEFDNFMSSTGSDRSQLVYCSFSTFWSTDKSRIEPIVTLFRSRPDLTLVMGLGGRSKPADLGQLPDNVLVLEYAPQIDILASAKVVVTHGGISTINEALYHGVPLLVYSSGHVDQDGCMARVTYHKVGLSLDSNPIDPQELEAKLDLLLDQTGDNQVLDNARRIQAVLQRYDDQHAALQMLASVAGSAGQTPRYLPDQPPAE